MELDLSFLRAIAENPEGDADRLVFADWLDEHGHSARAQFIRNECEWARTGSGPARDTGWVREGTAAWLAVLPALKDNPWRFTRGTPDGVFYGKNPIPKFLRDAPRILSIPTIRMLHLDCVAVEGEEGYSNDWSEVRGGINDPEAEALANLAGLEQVRALRLQRATLSHQAWRSLFHSPHLTRLTSLDLAGCELADEVVHLLVNSPLAPRLAELYLYGERFNYCDYVAGYGGGWFNVSRTIDEAGVDTLAAAPSLAGLHVLNLNYNRLGRRAVEALVRSPHLSPELRLGIKIANRAGATPDDRKEQLDEDSLQMLAARFREVDYKWQDH